MADSHDIEIRGDDIRLGQLLKLAGVIDSGSDIKALLARGDVSVNGELETRRGRRLVHGDVVVCGSETVRVSAAS